jgi:signal transduction histidine kinase
LVVLIAVVISFLTLLFGLLFVVRPLRLLSDHTRRIGQGDFAAAAAPVGGVDEIEQLRRAVDQMAQQIQGYQAGLHSYLHAVTRAQEEERSRLARELHDETIQTLTALDHKVQKLQRTLEQEPAVLPQKLGPSIDELHRMVAGAAAEVRRFSRALRPLYLEDLGLAPALELLAKESGAGFTLGGAPRRVAPDVELALYRIAQESLSNARRHAEATQVEVTLVFGPRQVRLTVSDDGRGFDLPADLSSLARSGHFGLMSMQERAQLAGAQLEVETAPDQGTSIAATAAL